jgi:formylglycine-generating enzyme
MTELEAVALRRAQASAVEITPDTDMVRIPGGTFHMGSDKHYPEEAPVRRVTVDPVMASTT